MADNSRGGGHGRLAMLDILTDVGVIAVLKKFMEEKGAKALGGALPTEDEALWQRILMKLRALTDADGAQLHDRARQMFLALNGIGEQAFFLHVLQADYHRLVELYKAQTKKEDPLDELVKHVREVLEAYPNPEQAAQYIRETRGAVAHWITKVPDWGRALLDKLGLGEALSPEDTQRLGETIGRIAAGGSIDDLATAIEDDISRRREERQARRAERSGGDGGDGDEDPDRPRRRRRRGGMWFAIIFLVVAALVAWYATTHDAQHLMGGPVPAWQKAAAEAAPAAGEQAAASGATRHWYSDSLFWLFALMVAFISALVFVAIALYRRPARRSSDPDRGDQHGGAIEVTSDRRI